MSKRYKIGTRGSLLALTQSTQIKAQLENLTGDHFELVTITTQGDLQTQAPLWQLEGKDFFTRELDQALLSQQVDLVVHSYKDLGSERPAGIKLAAITQREFAQDILLIKQSTIKNLKNMRTFRVGTSSPRRMVNIGKQLKDLLPHGTQLELHVDPLRGNVNTRVSKLQQGSYDAIVLALAGLERLSRSESSRAELKPLLEGLDYMILPPSLFPPAASQGALALECLAGRSDAGELEQKLKKLEHAQTVAEVARERRAFKAYGGGCHLAVGIHVKQWHNHFVHYHRGEVDHQPILQFELEGMQLPKSGPGLAFVGMPKNSEAGDKFVTDSFMYDEYMIKRPINQTQLPPPNKHWHVTSRYCLNFLNQHANIKRAGLWSAGTQTWKQLAHQGYWVNGCSDALGEQELQELQRSQVLSILSDKNWEHQQQDWLVLSHPEASSKLGAVIGCYQRVLVEISTDYEKKLRACSAFYWSSYPQYEAFTARFPFIKDKIQACGLGKTYERFQAAGIPALAFVQLSTFKQWHLASKE